MTGSTTDGRHSVRLRGRERGFSVTELLVVLSFAGIVMAAAVFNLRGTMAREEIDSWVRSMTGDIAAAQQAAMTRRTTVTVTLTATSFSIAAGASVLRQDTLPVDISMTTTCPGNVCSFSPRGLPVAGTITVSSASTGRSYTIRIESGTGRVSFSEP